MEPIVEESSNLVNIIKEVNQNPCDDMSTVVDHSSIDRKETEMEAPDLNLDNNWNGLPNDCLPYLRKLMPSTDQPPSISEFKVDNDTFKRIPWPDNRLFYTLIGSVVSKLEIVCIPEGLCNEILPLFTALKDMSISYDHNMGTSFVSRIPDGLNRLTLSGRMIKDVQATEDLFRRLSPTLEVLNIEYMSHGEMDEAAVIPNSVTHGLMYLRNIRQFKCHNVTVSNDFLHFMRLNKNNLRSLDVAVWEDNILNADLWRIISQMHSVEFLSTEWLRISFSECIPIIPQGSLLMLKKLILRISIFTITQFKSLVLFIERLDKSNLQYLYFETNFAFLTVQEIFKDMPELEELHLRYSYRAVECSKVIIGKILGLTKLKILSILFFGDESILQLIEALPNLAEIIDYGYTGERLKVLEYIRKSNRRFILNGVQLY